MQHSPPTPRAALPLCTAAILHPCSVRPLRPCCWCCWLWWPGVVVFAGTSGRVNRSAAYIAHLSGHTGVLLFVTNLFFRSVRLHSTILRPPPPSIAFVVESLPMTRVGLERTTIRCLPGGSSGLVESGWDWQPPARPGLRSHGGVNLREFERAVHQTQTPTRSALFAILRLVHYLLFILWSWS